MHAAPVVRCRQPGPGSGATLLHEEAVIGQREPAALIGGIGCQHGHQAMLARETFGILDPAIAFVTENGRSASDMRRLRAPGGRDPKVVWVVRVESKPSARAETGRSRGICRGK